MKREDIVLTCTIIGAITAVVGAIVSIDLSFKVARLGRAADRIADNVRMNLEARRSR